MRESKDVGEFLEVLDHELPVGSCLEDVCVSLEGRTGRAVEDKDRSDRNFGERAHVLHDALELGTVAHRGARLGEAVKDALDEDAVDGRQ